MTIFLLIIIILILLGFGPVILAGIFALGGLAIIGLIIFLISVVFHSLLTSRVMHIYHLISLILIIRYTTGNSFLIKTYLLFQIFMSFYMVNLSQIYFPGIRDGSLILILSAVMFCYIVLHELTLHLARVKNMAQ